MYFKKNLILVIFYFFSLLISCTTPCTQDNAYQFDRRGRPIKKHKKSYPMAVFMPRCKVARCNTRKMHCHGSLKYRGSPWWQNQNPSTGQDIKIYMNN